MKVKLLISRVGADFSQNAGDEIDVDDAEAERMLEAGQCVFIKQLATKKEKSEKAAIE